MMRSLRWRGYRGMEGGDTKTCPGLCSRSWPCAEHCHHVPPWAQSVVTVPCPILPRYLGPCRGKAGVGLTGPC